MTALLGHVRYNRTDPTSMASWGWVPGGRCMTTTGPTSVSTTGLGPRWALYDHHGPDLACRGWVGPPVGAAVARDLE